MEGNERENMEENSLEENPYNISEDLESNINLEENEQNKEMEQYENNSVEDNDNLHYNPAYLNLENIIKYFMDKEILVNKIICDKCEQPMKLVKNKMKKIKLFGKNEDNKHVITVNIKNKSIFQSMRTDLRILYFLLSYNFVDNISINHSYLNCKELTKDLGL